MSAYVEAETNITDRDCLVSALVAAAASIGVNWAVSDIEVHDTPQNLSGYRGDVRQDTADVIIRRSKVGSASNDIGFKRGEDGRYVAIISQYDRLRYGEAFLGSLKQNYATEKVRKNAKKRGYRVEETKDEKGKVRLTLRR